MTTPKAQRGRKPKYPFRTMKPSDSFPVPEGKHNSVRSAAIAFCKRHPELGMKFSVRTSWDGWTQCFRVL